MTPILNLDAVILKEGSHVKRSADALCVMEAVAWMAGEKHSDQPTCACPVISTFLRNWNDHIKDDETRTRLLKPLVPLLVNSKSTSDVELRRSYLALDWLARVQAPAWLSLQSDLKAHALALAGLTPLTSAEACREAQPMLDAARDAARAAARAVLAPTVVALQNSALDLVHRMLAEGQPGLMLPAASPGAADVT